MSLKYMSRCILDISVVLQKVHATITGNDTSICETKMVLNSIKNFLIPALRVISTNTLVASVKLALDTFMIF